MLTLTLPSFAGVKSKLLTREQKAFAKKCAPHLLGKWHSIDLKHVSLNGYKQAPAVSFIIQEDGSVTDVKLIKSSGSPTVDRSIVSGTALTRYNKRPGCGALEVKTFMNIDFGT